MKQSVTVIGLGNMGAALAASFLAAGHPTTVWNRGPGKAAPSVALGAQAPESLTTALQASPLIVMCVTDYAATREILTPVTAELAGRTVVTLNSGTPDAARLTAEWVNRQGADYLDGAIMAVPPAIGQPETLILYSGTESVFEDHRATLSALGGQSDLVGEDPGQAVLFESAIGATLMPAFWGFLFGAAMLRTADASAADLVPYAHKWMDAVIKPGFAEYAREVDAGDFADTTATVELFAHSSRAELSHFAAMGLDTDIPQAFQRLLDAALSQGHEHDSFSSLINVIERPNAE